MQPTRGRDREREYILRTPLFVPDETSPVTRVAPLYKFQMATSPENFAG
jgi:hypothetical protein